MTDLVTPLPYRWIGRHPVLDFANTVAWEAPDDRGVALTIPRHERLTSYDRLVEWSVHAGLLDHRESPGLLERAGHASGEADQTLERAIHVREAIHRLVVTRLASGRVPSDTLATLNRLYREANEQRVLVETPTGFTLARREDQTRLDAPLWCIATAAVELLASDALADVRVCDGNSCGFLFLDTSHGHRRRWCDMAHCGNVAKVRRHRQRDQIREHTEA